MTTALPHNSTRLRVLVHRVPLDVLGETIPALTFHLHNGMIFTLAPHTRDAGGYHVTDCVGEFLLGGLRG